MRKVLILAASLGGMSLLPLQADDVPIVIKEEIGCHWRQELVHWPVPDTTAAWKLVDGDGHSIPCQRHNRDARVPTPLNGSGLYALVDLAEGGELRWRMRTGEPEPVKSRVRVERSPDGVVLGNEHLDVRLVPDTDAPDADRLPYPILAMRQPGGAWFGRGSLTGVDNVRRIRTTILAEGPLFAEAEVVYEFDAVVRDTPRQDETRPAYAVVVRVVAGQPVAHMGETFDLNPGAAAAFTLAGVGPLTTWNGQRKKGGNHYVDIITQPLPDSPQALPPIPVWTWYADAGNPNSSWFAAWNEAGPGPVVGVFACFPQAWRRTRPDAQSPDGVSYMDPGGIELRLAESGEMGFRHSLAQRGSLAYCLYLSSREAAAAAKPSGIAAAKRSYAETPLQRVKDWTLDWAHAGVHPQLFFSREDIPRLRARMQQFDAFKPLLTARPEKLTFIEDLVWYYLATGDGTAAQELLYAGQPLEGPRLQSHELGLLHQLRGRVQDMFLGYGLHPAGMNNMMWLPDHMLYRLITADVLLGAPEVGEAERRDICRLLAILAYQMERPEMVPERNRGLQIGMPNFIPPYYGTLGMIGALLADHPDAGRWMARCEDELLHNIRRQVTPQGGWYESYYYQERTMRGYVPAAVALARAGRQGLITAPSALAAFRGQISQLTPRDPRVGMRCYPPIGDGTYYVPKLNLFWAAEAVARFDPDLSAQMMWTWHEQGRPLVWIPELSAPRDPYALALGNPDLPSRPPSLGSEQINGCAVILRSRFNQPHESYFHLRAADFALSHFQDDQLSFHWYAKGAPLCLDWGYYGIKEHRPAASHNRTVIHNLKDWAGEIVQTVFLPRSDYVHTRNTDDNTRIRRLLYVRGDTAEEPEYIVLRDTLAGPGDWNLWSFALDFDAPVTQPKDSRPPPGNASAPALEPPWKELHQPGWVGHEKMRSPVDVPLAEPCVRYRGAFDVDLTVRWFGPVSKVMMGASQWGWSYDPAKPENVGSGKGEHQKLLRLVRDAAGDMVAVLYPTLRGREPQPVIEAWGPQGVSIRRSDGVRHRAWVSPGAWSHGQKEAAPSLLTDSVSAEGAAVLLCEWPDERQEALLFDGTRLSTEWVTVQRSTAGTVALGRKGDELVCRVIGDGAEIRLSGPAAGNRNTVLLKGQPLPSRRQGDELVFSAPAGSHDIILKAEGTTPEGDRHARQRSN